MVTLIKTLGAAAEANGDEICVLHAGDGITGTPYYSAYGPEADAAAMSLVGFDAFVVGNHEFDDVSVVFFVRCCFVVDSIVDSHPCIQPGRRRLGQLFHDDGCSLSVLQL